MMWAMAYTVPDLPYPYDALEPHISAQTMRFHHDKHHQAYVDKANAALAGTGLEDAEPREILTRLTEFPPDKRAAVRNNVGGHLNHSMFWESMTPDSPARGRRGDSKLMAAIRETFRGMPILKETIKDAAMSQFGSGWAWLVHDGYRILIVTTADQDSPITDGLEPLLGIDVWEHAYYLDYENRRAEYVDAWLNVVDWEVVERRFDERAGARRLRHRSPRLVSVCGTEHEFGKVTLDEARAHSAELKALAGWGPLAKVGAIAPQLGRPRAADAEGQGHDGRRARARRSIEQARDRAVGHPARTARWSTGLLGAFREARARQCRARSRPGATRGRAARGAGRRRAARGRRSTAG